MVEHSLDEVPGYENLFGENIQQLVVDGEVSLHSELRHLLQSSVDELNVTTSSDVSLEEHVHRFVKRGLGFIVFGHLLEQVVVGNQRLILLLVVVVVIVDEFCRYGPIFGTHGAAMETPQCLQQQFVLLDV